MLAFLAPLDLALTYALRRPKLALSLLREAYTAAVKLKRPDLAFQVNALIIVVRA